MNKIFWLFFLCHTCLPYLSEAQKIPREPSTTRHLKDSYLYIKDKAKKNQYYLNEFMVNSNALFWNDNVIRQKSYLYYYTFLGDNTPFLRLAVVIEKTNDTEIRTEFMYDQDGNLGYCIEKQNDKNLAYREFHVFYEKELCINLMLDKDIIDPKDTPPHQSKIDNLKKVGKVVFKKFSQDQLGLEH